MKSLFEEDKGFLFFLVVVYSGAPALRRRDVDDWSFSVFVIYLYAEL